jgi:hypothetical protein
MFQTLGNQMKPLMKGLELMPSPDDDSDKRNGGDD